MTLSTVMLHPGACVSPLHPAHTGQDLDLVRKARHTHVQVHTPHTCTHTYKATWVHTPHICAHRNTSKNTYIYTQTYMGHKHRHVCM